MFETVAVESNEKCIMCHHTFRPSFIFFGKMKQNLAKAPQLLHFAFAM
jgi:hypothetical protein